MTLTLHDIDIAGCEPDAIADVRRRGIDHGGRSLEPFVDDEGGWPLRCCLADSSPNDELAIIAWSPFPWRGVYAETGPIVIHARDCGGPAVSGVPEQFLSRRQLLRPYTFEHRIAYHDIKIVDGDGSLLHALSELLERAHIDFVHVRNVLSGCYSFTARRRGTGSTRG